MRLPVDGSSYEVRQFVCVLADHGDTDGSWPVVVEMAQLVSQFLKETKAISLIYQLSHTDQKNKSSSIAQCYLEVLRLERSGVLDDVVGGWVDRSLPDGLRDEVEVVPLREGHDVVHHRSGRGVGSVVTHHREEPDTNANFHLCVIMRSLCLLPKKCQRKIRFKMTKYSIVIL